MNGDILIRDVENADMASVQEIYAHHVLEGLASWEETPPDVAELKQRRDEILGKGYPYRVAVVGNTVKGYAYAGPYRMRPAYLHTVENSVYVDVNAHRQGIGRLLLQDLIECCRDKGFRQMIAIIGDSSNDASVGLHANLGFEKIGTLPSVGFKFGRWLDQVIMQRALGDGDETLPNE